MNSLASYFNSFSSGIAVIARPKLSGFGEHWGVILPNGYVVHSTDDKGPHCVLYQEFAAGRPVKEIRKVPMSEYHATMQRVQQELSLPEGYRLLDNNCEIFANRVTGWVQESPQVKGWGLFLAVVSLITIAAKA